MAYVTPIYGGSAAQVDYRLGISQPGHGCGSDAQFRYHADGRERPLRWIGGGLSVFGVDGVEAGAVLTAEQFDLARVLMAGKHMATGEQLVGPKVAVPANAKVPLGPLVAAVTALAAERGIADPVELFGKPKQRSGWNTAVRAVANRGDAALLRVDDALALAQAAGLEAEQVWPDIDLIEVYSKLFEQTVVRGEDGKTVLDANGMPTYELTPRRVPVGIVGFDIGITVPKSTSLLLAFLPDALIDRVEASYTEAIERTFGWVEGRTSYVRRGKHGEGMTARVEQTAGFSGWVMTHRAARPVGEAVVGDPHWHVHITVANMAQAPDGTWLTVAAGGRDLMRHAPAIDKVTQAQIRASLHNQFGITFARAPRTGIWEVAQIPDEAIVYFSKRGHQVTDVLKQLGYTNADVSAAQARMLTRESRSAKTETTAASDTTLRGLWRSDALRGGFDPDALMDTVLTSFRAGERAAPAEVSAEVEARFGIGLDALVAELTDPDRGLTAHARRFSRLDAIAVVADALPHGAEIAEVEHLTGLVLAHPSFVALPSGADAELTGGLGAHAQLAGAHRMSGGELFTTADVIAVERAILTTATAANDAQDRARVLVATLDLAVPVVEAAQGFLLSAEQRAVLRAVTLTGRAVEAIEGPPGTGKTTLMRAARVAWEAAGYRVAGAATAAVAAQNLAAESGIPSRTVEQWLWRIQHRDGLSGVDVLVLDEANLTDDRDRATLYRAAAQAGTKIVEVGDPKQLRGVGVGSMFGYLHERLAGPRITENRRQHQADERQALSAFRAGRYAEALQTWARIGGVVATETPDEAVAAMVGTWLGLRMGAPDPHTLTAGLLMLAATNEQVGRINDATQAVRHRRGELGAGVSFRMPGGNLVRFHTGDLVLVRRNDRHEQAVQGDAVLNGYRGVVTAVTPKGVEVEWRDPAAALGEPLSRATLSAGYIAQGGLELGYALTAHKAEGLTVGGMWQRPDGSTNDGSVLVYGPGMDNPGLYVSLSRDKGQTVLFGARAELEGDREDLVYGPPRNQTELTDRVVAALAEKAAATAENANDRPVLVDFGQAPAGTAEPTGPTPQASEREPVRDAEPARAAQRSRREVQSLRERAARLTADPEALRAIESVRAVLGQLDPQPTRQAPQPSRAARVPEREQEELDRRQDRERRRAEWQARPHGRLTAGQLTTAISQAEQRHTRQRATADAARRQVAEREPVVAAGQGPRVTGLEAEREQLRYRAQVQRQAEDIERRWQAVVERAADAAERQAHAELDAQRTRWWQTGQRERLMAQAAEHRAQENRAQEEALALARQAAELQQQLGGPRVWRLASEQAERAEARYPEDRIEAQRQDKADLTRAQQRVNQLDRARAEAGAQRDELAAEQQLREAMPQIQRMTESVWRIEANQHDRIRALAQTAAQPEPQPDLAPPETPQWELDYHERTMDRGIDIDRGGPSLGM
jgi:conjugative relaxase-like TrwC/TraI family protein